MCKCQICKKDLKENDFYKIVTERMNIETNEYEPFKICKQCFKSQYFHYSKENIKELILKICKMYNLYYDINLLDGMMRNNGAIDLIKYIKTISSLKQYDNKKYKDSVFVVNPHYHYIGDMENNRHTFEFEPRKHFHDFNSYDSDLDFLDNDIRQLKAYITYASENGDFNAHNKWMNCLRDAIELRESLNKKKDLTVEQIDNLNLDWGIDITKDQNGEDICRIPIFINGHFIKSIFVKYVDGKYEPRNYFINTSDINAGDVKQFNDSMKKVTEETIEKLVKALKH